MNFYGTTTGPQHTLFGRVAPMMEAMRLAIYRAAEQPLPAVQLTHDLPVWVHHIADELTCTVFKEVVNLAPQTNKFHARTYGRYIGLLLRAGLFYWKDAPATLEREGFNKLTPEREAKLDKLVGWELACAYASKLAGCPITTKAQVTRFFAARLERFVFRTTKAACTLIIYALHQPVGDVLEFLTGIPEGFKCFLRTDGEFAKTGKRTEVFMLLLTYWPEIEEMRHVQPPLQKPYVLAWLEKQEGKQLVPSDHAFSELCTDIKLDFGLTGHPFNRADQQV